MNSLPCVWYSMRVSGTCQYLGLYHATVDANTYDEPAWSGGDKIDPIAIGLTGRIGSGKSTIAGRLSHRLGCLLVSFGDYVRAEAWREGGEIPERNCRSSASCLSRNGAGTTSVVMLSSWRLETQN